MATAHQSGTTSNYLEGSGEDDSFSFNNVSGDFLVVRVKSWNCGGTQQHADGATYNGVAMTQAVEHAYSIGGGCFLTNAIYYLAGPATGTNTVAVSFDAINYGGITTNVDSFTGVEQTTPLDDSDQVDCGCGDCNRTLTISASDAVVVTSISPADTYSPLSGQTESPAEEGGYIVGVASGSFNDNWDLTSGCGAADMVDAAFKAATGAATGQPTHARREMVGKGMSLYQPSLFSRR